MKKKFYVTCAPMTDPHEKVYDKKIGLIFVVFFYDRNYYYYIIIIFALAF